MVKSSGWPHQNVPIYFIYYLIYFKFYWFSINSKCVFLNNLMIVYYGNLCLFFLLDSRKIYRAWNIKDKSVVAVKMHYSPKSIICGILNDSPHSLPEQCLVPKAEKTHEVTVNLLMHSQSVNGTKFCSRVRNVNFTHLIYINKIKISIVRQVEQVEVIFNMLNI